MGIISALKHASNLEKLYSADIARQVARDKLIRNDVTEDWVKELMRQADTGVQAEIIWPSGAILRITRTLSGMDVENTPVGIRGIRFKEDF
jgi:hypothetical protein